MRQGMPLVICFIAGIVMIVAYFIPHAPFGATRGVFEQWFLVIQAFAMVLGVLNLMKINGQKVMRKKAGWGYSVVLLVALSVTIVSGLGWGMGEGTVFGWIFENINIPLGATMFSLLAFFVAVRSIFSMSFFCVWLSSMTCRCSFTTSDFTFLNASMSFVSSFRFLACATCHSSLSRARAYLV